MQPIELQQPTNPWQACTNNTHLDFKLNAKHFTRALDLFSAPFKDLSFNLHFSQNEAKQLLVTGSLEGEVNLECQRCLKPVAVDLHNEFTWGLVTSDEAADNLARELEPVYLQDNKIDLFAAIEDELLLSLPLVAYHKEDECQMPSFEQPQLELEPEPLATEETHKPFLVLHQLKKGSTKK